MGRFFALVGAGIGTLIGGVMLTLNENTIGYWFLGIAGPLFILGVYDVIQARHTLWRNYPIISHMRWLFEGIRPEIRQYLIESDADSFPFNREQRSLVYKGAKNRLQTTPLGTQKDAMAPDYTNFTHPRHLNLFNQEQ